MNKIKEKIKASIYLLSYFETLGFKNGEWEFNYNFKPPQSVDDIAFQNISIIHHFFSLGGFNNIDITEWNSSDDTIMTIHTANACINGGSEKEYIDEYLNTLTEKQKIAYKIAVDMLGTSFDVEKSLGFKKWMKEEKNIDLY